MPKIDFAVGSFLAGIVLTLILLAADKADKLKGPWPLILLAVAAVLTLPLALSVSVVTNAQGTSRGFRVLAAICLVGFVYAVLAAWLSAPTSTPAPAATPQPSPAPISNLRFVRAGIEHISLDGDISRRIRSASQQGHVALVAVFEPELADTEIRAAISFNDPANSQTDRACWLYEKSHIAKLKRGERKELLIGYKQHNGFVRVENDYERDRSLKVQLLNGNELIADVRLLSTTPVEAQHHKFKVTVEPTFGIEKIDNTST